MCSIDSNPCLTVALRGFKQQIECLVQWWVGAQWMDSSLSLFFKSWIMINHEVTEAWGTLLWLRALSLDVMVSGKTSPDFWGIIRFQWHQGSEGLQEGRSMTIVWNWRGRTVYCPFPYPCKIPHMTKAATLLSPPIWFEAALEPTTWVLRAEQETYINYLPGHNCS